MATLEPVTPQLADKIKAQLQQRLREEPTTPVPSSDTPPTSQNSETLTAKSSNPTICPDCNGNGFIRGERAGNPAILPCHCKRRAIVDAKIRNSVPERYQNANFATFQPRNPSQAKAAAAILQNPTGSFFLAGKYAKGKTHLAAAQFRAVSELYKPELNESAVWISSTHLVEELKAHALGDPSLLVIRSREYAKFHLFIDDLDQLKPTEFNQEAIHALIETLYSRKLSLTITSNWNLTELAKSQRIHPAATRRIDDMCQLLEL